MADYTQRRITMVDTQVRPSDVTKFPILDAMLSVPRELYVPTAAQDLAYVGGPIALSDTRQLMEPRTIAKLLDALDLGPTDMVLELAPGLGYTTALLAYLVEAVVALEEDEDMARDAEATLNSAGVDNAAVITGPVAEGSAKHAPFDAIVAFAGVETMPEAILDQVKEGGRIGAVFMDGALGEARVGLKSGGKISWRMAFNATAPVLPGFARAPSFEF
jgi:protein-L-isoaspartate(D-aspartate) O-methyltransferase